MNTGKIAVPTIIIIFGGTGDLTKRKLIPAFYHLFLDGWPPEKFAIVGLGRSEFNNADYRKQLRVGLIEFSRSGRPTDEKWSLFQEHITYFPSDIKNSDFYAQM